MTDRMIALTQVRLMILVCLVVLSSAGILTEPAPRSVAAGISGIALSVQPETRVVAPGEIFDLEVVLDQGENVSGVSVASLGLRFDSAVLQAQAIEVASPLLPAQEEVTIDGATAGLVIGARSCEDALRVPRQLTIARIAFQAVGEAGTRSQVAWREAVALSPVACGIRDLQTQDWDGVSENMVKIVHGATICVESEPAPCEAPPATPRMVLSPEQGARGTNVKVTLSGFQSGDEVAVTWDQGKPKNKKGHHKGKGKNKKPGKRFVRVGTVTIALDGEARVNFTVPRKARAGGHAVAASGAEGSHATARFTVTSERARSPAEDSRRGSRRRAGRG